VSAPAGLVEARWPAWPVSGPAAELLWGETGAGTFHAARDNAARALRVLRRALARDLAGDAAREFVGLSGGLAAAALAAFEPVWADPRAYAWMRAAHALAASGPADALDAHLHQFKAFSLGIAWHAGADCAFVTPASVALPFALPGSRLSVDGAGTVALLGLASRRLLVVRDGTRVAVPLEAGATAGGLTVRECPVARAGDHMLPLHPHALHVKGLAVGEPAVRAGLGYHARHVPLIERTLAAMERHAPESFAAFRRVIRLIGLKPLAWGGFDDFSPAEMPGAFVASVVANPLVLADHFIHELQHNRLQLIEEGGPLFEDGTGEEARHYSPWRDKPRGLYGIFHGVYVFVAVYRYWHAVVDAPEVGAEDRAFALDRVVRLPAQLELALGVLGRHARLTALGRIILDQLTRDAARIRQAAAFAGAPADTAALTVGEDGAVVAETSAVDGRPITVREAVVAHLQRNAAHADGAVLPSGWAAS
jgi:HEXXH motif-containing protein